MNRRRVLIPLCLFLVALLSLTGCNLSERTEVTPSSTLPASVPATTKPTSSTAFSIDPTNRTITERLILQNYPTGPAVVISPDGRRTAYFSGQSIVVDGVETKLSHRPFANTLVFSPDSKRLAYAANRDNKFIDLLIRGKHILKGAIKMAVQGFFRSLKIDLKSGLQKVIEKQKDVLKYFIEANIIDETEIDNYILTKDDFPHINIVMPVELSDIPEFNF